MFSTEVLMLIFSYLDPISRAKLRLVNCFCNDFLISFKPPLCKQILVEISDSVLDENAKFSWSTLNIPRPKGYARDEIKSVLTLRADLSLRFLKFIIDFINPEYFKINGNGLTNKRFNRLVVYFLMCHANRKTLWIENALPRTMDFPSPKKIKKLIYAHNFDSFKNWFCLLNPQELTFKNMTMIAFEILTPYFITLVHLKKFFVDFNRDFALISLYQNFLRFGEIYTVYNMHFILLDSVWVILKV